MLLATMVLLLQLPVTLAGQAPATPQASAPIFVAENSPAKLPLPNSSAAAFSPAPQTDLFDRDKIRLVDFSSVIDDTANDDTKHATQPSSADDGSSLLAEVHIPTETEVSSNTNFHPERIAVETPGHTWLALSLVQHGAATFDAWTTQRAVDQGHTELNPMLRPFAGNASIYAAIQVGPLLFDYLGRHMQRSEHHWMRQIWWLPQSLSTAASLCAGAHNLSVSK